MASTSAERSSDRNPALPHRLAAFSVNPASVQWRASSSGWFSAISANWLSSVSAMSMKRPSRLAQQRAVSRVLH
jgi:hypothetical protein